MDVYQSEDEQVEALKKWWDDNGKSILAGVILGLGAIFGWRAWQDHKIAQAEAASQLYQQIFDELGKEEGSAAEVQAIANEISGDYGSTAYAVFAKLTLAKVEIANNNYDAAVSHLRWALDNNHNDNIEHLIKLRLARVLLAQDKLTEAKTLLSGKTSGQFSASYDELRGDIAVQESDFDSARTAYQQALSKRRLSAADTSVLELKLADLGPATL